MKINNLYNLKALDESRSSIRDVIANTKFSDNLGGVILSENLTATDPTILERKYPELVFMNSGIEFDNTGGYSSQIESLKITRKGGFKLSSDSDDSKGQISLNGENSKISVRELQTSANWTDSQVQTYSLQGINLLSHLLETIDLTYKQDLDAVGLVGLEAVYGVPNSKGLLNNTAFPATAAGGTIKSMTPIEKRDVFVALINDQRNAVAGTVGYIANKVIMPFRVFEDLNTTILDSSASTATVLASLRESFPEIEFSYTYRADTIANQGDLAVSATVAFNASRESMRFRLPLPLEISPEVQVGGFKKLIDAKFRVAGLDVLESSTGRILTGL